jgi:hypothetical protein
MEQPSAENLLVIKLCKCGRAPHRKGQRNCHHCNREANAKYRRELKRMEIRLKAAGISRNAGA